MREGKHQNGELDKIFRTMMAMPCLIIRPLGEPESLSRLRPMLWVARSEVWCNTYSLASRRCHTVVTRINHTLKPPAGSSIGEVYMFYAIPVPCTLHSFFRAIHQSCRLMPSLSSSKGLSLDCSRMTWRRVVNAWSMTYQFFKDGRKAAWRITVQRLYEASAKIQ